MTNEEIKKGLEICCDDNYNYRCCGCPYNSVRHCNDALENDARNLISKQEQEIAQLKADYSKLQEQFAQYQMASDKEIAAQVKQAKIDVLNKLKTQTHNYYPSIDSYCVSQHVVLVKDIDKMIVEVQNAEDKS